MALLTRLLDALRPTPPAGPVNFGCCHRRDDGQWRAGPAPRVRA